MTPAHGTPSNSRTGEPLRVGRVAHAGWRNTGEDIVRRDCELRAQHPDLPAALEHHYFDGWPGNTESYDIVLVHAALEPKSDTGTP